MSTKGALGRLPPLPRQFAFMLVLPFVVLGLWLLLPDSPVAVIALGVVVLGFVFVAVGWVMSSRLFSDAPPRYPAPPER